MTKVYLTNFRLTGIRFVKEIGKNNALFLHLVEGTIG